MSAPEDLIGGRYRLVHRLAAGGMGSVWQGWDERLQRPVAIKQLLHQPGLSEQDAQLSVDRAMREARITARLHHPHAVPVYDVVSHDGRPCLIMQYVPSESLQQLLDAKGVLAQLVVAGIGADVASALAAAHQAGIVHRDVKPSNVLITEDGRAKLTDFGVSHAVGDISLTSTGMVTGTPAYLSPEAARGDPATAASDVFSLGATLYVALEGNPPFGKVDNPMAVLHRVATGQVIAPRASGPLAPLLSAMLAADPADRPPMIDVQHTLAALHSDLGSMQGMTQQLPVLPPGRQGDQSPTGVLAPVSQPPPNKAPNKAPSRPPAGAAPAIRPGPAAGRRRGPAVAVLLLVLTGAVLTAVLLNHRHGRPAAAATSPTSRPPASSTAPASTPAPSSTAPQPPAPSKSSTQPKSKAPPKAPAGRAARLSRAITDYYALLPADTARGWTRLTANYQQGTAQSRQYYDSFWAAVAQVTVTGVTAQPPDSVLATVTYHYRDGRVITERTAYRLVDEHGVLKIDGSSVLTSQAQ